MNTQKQDGGPAFPKTVDGTQQRQDGMSLRDYFAAAALASCRVGDWLENKDKAKWCYDAADAMMQQRSET